MENPPEKPVRQKREETIEAHKIIYRYDTEDKVIGIRYALVSDGGVKGLDYTYNGNRWLESVKAVLEGSDHQPLVRTYAYDGQGYLHGI